MPSVDHFPTRQTRRADRCFQCCLDLGTVLEHPDVAHRPPADHSDFALGQLVDQTFVGHVGSDVVGLPEVPQQSRCRREEHETRELIDETVILNKLQK